jgi:hypothetical protein
MGLRSQTSAIVSVNLHMHPMSISPLSIYIWACFIHLMGLITDHHGRVVGEGVGVGVGSAVGNLVGRHGQASHQRSVTVRMVTRPFRWVSYPGTADRSSPLGEVCPTYLVGAEVGDSVGDSVGDDVGDSVGARVRTLSSMYAFCCGITTCTRTHVTSMSAPREYKRIYIYIYIYIYY